MKHSPIRIAAAVLGVAFLSVSAVGMGTLAAQALPPDPAPTPVITAPADGSNTTDRTPFVDFSVTETNLTVTVFANGGFYCSIDLGGSTIGQCASGVDLPIGPVQFTAQSDYTLQPGLFQSAVSGPVTVTIESTDPVAFTVEPPASSTDPTPTFAGTGPTNGEIEVIGGGSALCNTIAGPDGTWECTSSPLLPALWTGVQAAGWDAIGNPVGTAVGSDFTIEDPTAYVEQTFNPWWTSADAVQVQGGMSEDVTEVRLYSSPDPGGPFTTPFCTEPGEPGLTIYFCDAPPGSLAPGDNYIVAEVTNAAGAVSAQSAPILITRVTEPVITAPAFGSYTNNPNPTFSGTADDTYFDSITVADGDEGQLVLCNAVVQPDDTWTCQAFAVEDGVYTPFAEASPNFIYSDRTEVTVDTVAPAPPTVNPLTTNDTTPTVTGTGQQGSEVTLLIDGEPVFCSNSTFVNEGAEWSCILEDPLSVGTHDVAASQTDRAGNTSAVSVTQPSLVITPTITPVIPPPAPPAPTPSPTPTPTPTPTPVPQLLLLAWTLGGAGSEYEPGDAVTLTGSGLPAGAFASAEIHSTPRMLGTDTVAADGTFAIAAVIPEDIEPGEHTFVVTVTADGAEPSVVEQAVTVMPKASEKAVLETERVTDVVSTVIASEIGGDAGEADRNAPDTPSSLTDSLDTVLDIIRNPVVIGTAAVLGLGLLLFVAVPAELLNATLSEQYDRFAKRMPRLRKSPTWWQALRAQLAATPVVGAIVLTALVAIIFGFADPGFGFDLTSLRVVLACALGLLVVGFVANALTGIVIAKRWDLASRMELKPLGVILAVVGVLLSRLLEFTPGFLLGLLLGIALVGRVTLRDEVRTTLTKVGFVFGFAIVAWLGYSLFGEALTQGGFGGNLAIDTLAAITTEGLTALLIGLLPFKVLEGESLWKASKWLWAGVWLFVAAVFALIVLPTNFSELGGSAWVWGITVAGFAVVSLAVYGYFRWIAKPMPDEEDEVVAEQDRVGSRAE